MRNYLIIKPILVFSFLMTSSLQQASAELYPKDWFDQTKILQDLQQHSPHLTKHQINDILVKKYQAKKNAYHRWEAFGCVKRLLLGNMANFLAFFIGGATWDHLQSNPDSVFYNPPLPAGQVPTPPTLMGAAMAQAFSRTLLEPAMKTYTDIIGHFMHTNIQKVINLLWRGPASSLELMERKYVKKRRFIKSDLWEKTEMFLRDPWVCNANALVKYMKNLLALPRYVKKKVFDPVVFDQLLEGYPTHLAQLVKLFCFQQVLNQPSIGLDQRSALNLGKRISAYFCGEPGTGKTRLAELVAKGLGVPFIRLSLEGATISDIIGASNEEEFKQGLLAEALSKAKLIGPNGKPGKTLSSAVLFMDEVDRALAESPVLLPFLLKLLDPETKTYYNPYFGAEIDISHLTIILAGNSSLLDKALENRLYVINFGKLDPTRKKAAIYDSTLKELCTDVSQNGMYKIAPEDLTPADRTLIDQLIAADEDPGFRTLQKVLKNFLTYKLFATHIQPGAPMPDFLREIRETNALRQQKA